MKIFFKKAIFVSKALFEKTFAIYIYLLMLSACGFPNKTPDPINPQAISLKIINYNTWHCLGEGFFKRQVLEPEGRQEQRIQEQMELLKSADPDILFLQELNPASSLSERIAQELGMSYVYQITNCGISILRLGLPVNLSMGIAVMVKPPLTIHKILGLKLSGPPGFCKKYLSFQFTEFRYALFALAYHPEYGSLLLANTHFHHGPEWSDPVKEQLNDWERDEVLTQDQVTKLSTEIEKSNQRKKDELKKLFTQIDELQSYYQNLPLILAGDFNSTVNSPIYKDILEFYRLKDTTESYSPLPYTWDPESNPKNHQYTAGLGVPVSDFDIPEVADFFRKYDFRQRRIDYVFVSREFEVNSFKLFANTPNAQGLIASDHFGVEVSLKIEQE